MRKSTTTILAMVALSGLKASPAQAAYKYLNVPYEVQEMSNWCWAASVQMILEYRGRPFLDQCEIASTLGGLGGNPTTCCVSTQNYCNLPFPISQGSLPAFNYLFGPLNIASATCYRASLPYANAKAQINGNNPYIIYCGRSDGSGHYLVATGYADAINGLPNQIQVEDPWPGEGYQLRSYGAECDSGEGVAMDFVTTQAANTAADKATLYQNQNFSGTSLKTGSTTYVGDQMNDKTRSISTMGVPFIFYTDANYGGAAFEAPFLPNEPWGPGTAGALTSPFDKSISSVQAMPYASSRNTLVMFENENFSGAYTTVGVAGNSYLVPSGWDDRVSSMIVVSGIFQVYQDPNAGGLPYAVTGFGGPNRDGFYPNAQSWGGPDNDISSVYFVSSGRYDSPEHPILLYDDINLSGRGVAMTQYSPTSWFADLSNIGFSGRISSIKTFGNSTWSVYTGSYYNGAEYHLSPNAWYPDWTYWGGNNDEIYSVSFDSGTGGWGF
jgi:hypothetical protein